MMILIDGVGGVSEKRFKLRANRIWHK